MSDPQNPLPPEPQQPTFSPGARGLSLSDRVGIGGLVLTAISIAVFLWPDRKVAACVFGSVGIALLIVWIFLEVKSSKRRPQGISLPSKKAVGIIAGVVLAALIIVFALLPRPSVYPPFREAYDSHEAKLGKPTRKERVPRWIYHAQHEKATVILLNNPKTIYLLFHNGRKDLLQLPDEGVTTDTYWWNDEEVIKRFVEKFGKESGTPPPGRFPPFGPVAKGWYNNPDDYNKVGWRVTHCMYWDETVYAQRFEHGYIVGSLRHVPDSNDSQDGRVFVLFTDENRWEDEEGTRNTRPNCVQP
jgi:hypothetical protein